MKSTQQYLDEIDLPEGSINGMGKVIDVRKLIDDVKAEYKPFHDANHRLFEYLWSGGTEGMIESSCADTATTEIGRLASWNQQLIRDNQELRSIFLMYREHTSACEITNAGWSIDNNPLEAKCTCGLEQILNKLKQEGE